MKRFIIIFLGVFLLQITSALSPSLYKYSDNLFVDCGNIDNLDATIYKINSDGVYWYTGIMQMIINQDTVDEQVILT